MKFTNIANPTLLLDLSHKLSFHLISLCFRSYSIWAKSPKRKPLVITGAVITTPFLSCNQQCERLKKTQRIDANQDKSQL